MLFRAGLKLRAHHHLCHLTSFCGVAGVTFLQILYVKCFPSLPLELHAQKWELGPWTQTKASLVILSLSLTLMDQTETCQHCMKQGGYPAWKLMQISLEMMLLNLIGKNVLVGFWWWKADGKMLQVQCCWWAFAEHWMRVIQEQICGETTSLCCKYWVWSWFHFHRSELSLVNSREQIWC